MIVYCCIIVSTNYKLHISNTFQEHRHRTALVEGRNLFGMSQMWQTVNRLCFTMTRVVHHLIRIAQPSWILGSTLAVDFFDTDAAANFGMKSVAQFGSFSCFYLCFVVLVHSGFGMHQTDCAWPATPVYMCNRISISSRRPVALVFDILTSICIFTVIKISFSLFTKVKWFSRMLIFAIRSILYFESLHDEGQSKSIRIFPITIDNAFALLKSIAVFVALV